MLKAHNDLRVGVHSVTVQGCTGLNEQCRKHCGNVINSWGPDVTPGGQHTAALNSQWPMLKALNDPRVGVHSVRQLRAAAAMELMSSVVNNSLVIVVK